MQLYIQIEAGVPVSYPATEENIIQAFGTIPENWEPFVRTEKPTPGVYEVVIPDTAVYEYIGEAYDLVSSDNTTYERIDGVWTNSWSVRPMTPEEIATKKQNVIDAFFDRESPENWATWTLDEATCKMIPPVEKPEPIEGVKIFWCGAENTWKEAPPKPDEVGVYVFNYSSWQWVLLEVNNLQEGVL